MEMEIEILAVLLNNGTSPKTHKQLLKPETVEEMFRNQIPHLPLLKKKVIPGAKPDLANPATGFHPTSDDDPQGWGLSFLLSGGPSGRSQGSAQWFGIANLSWWCDRQKGLAGIICSQILPFGDFNLFNLFYDVETEIYKGLP